MSRFILKNKIANHNREKNTHGFSSARTCGVVFNATDKDDYEKALKFIAYIQELGIETDAVGYVHKRELMSFFLPHKNIDYFSKKNLNLFGVPNNPYIEDFVEKKFDILIDICFEEFFPVEYIVSLSKAAFKVGRQLPYRNYYDLMINIKDNNDLEYFINQIKHYLSILNRT